MGAKKIQVIKEVRGLTSLGLGEAKELVESARRLCFEKVNKETADKAKEALEGGCDRHRQVVKRACSERGLLTVEAPSVVKPASRARSIALFANPVILGLPAGAAG